MELLRDIEKYWTNRAEGYSQVNQEELAGENRYHWIRELEAQILQGEKKSWRFWILVPDRVSSLSFWQKRDIM